MSLLKLDNLNQDYKLTSSKKSLNKEGLLKLIIAKVNPTAEDLDKEGFKPFPIETVVNAKGESVKAMIIRYGSIRMAVAENKEGLNKKEFREAVASDCANNSALANKLWEQRKAFEKQNSENGGKS